MGKSRFCTKYTRAPVEVCQCCMGSCACAGSATKASTSATSHSKGSLRLITGHRLLVAGSLPVAHACRRRGGTLARERLRIEMRDGERVLHVVLARHLAHLLGRDFAQLLELQVDRLVRDAGQLQRADLAGLVHHG